MYLEQRLVTEARAVSVVVEPSAREMFTPRELAAAFKEFIERGPQYLDTETGIKAAAYWFDERVLLVYEEPETGLVVLIHPEGAEGESSELHGRYSPTHVIASGSHSTTQNRR